jgi:hypothetical protein
MTILISFGKMGAIMAAKIVTRKVYKMNNSGMVAITIPGKIMKEWGIDGLKEISIKKIDHGMFQLWATQGEMMRLQIGMDDVLLDKMDEQADSDKDAG